MGPLFASFVAQLPLLRFPTDVLRIRLIAGGKRLAMCSTLGANYAAPNTVKLRLTSSNSVAGQ